MTKGRNIAKTAAKLTIGFLLIAYVLHSRMIDFDALRTILFSPANLLLAIAFLTISAACCAVRWFLLARVQGLSLSRFTMFELTMIGNFFNTFMPGSVGGDVIKAWYVAGREPQRKTRAVFTLLLDRVIGLSVIIFYSACTIIFYTSWLQAHAELKMIALVVWTFTGTSAVVATLFFLSRSPKLSFLEKAVTWLQRWPRLYRIADSAIIYRNHLNVVLSALVLSFISILGQNLLYKFQGDLLGIPMDLAHYFFVVPVVMTISAVPLLPGGIGVGQVAFFKLFQWVGMSNPQQGATLCTVMQIYTILFNCTGAYFYVRFRRHPALVNPELASA